MLSQSVRIVRVVRIVERVRRVGRVRSVGRVGRVGRVRSVGRVVLPRLLRRLTITPSEAIPHSSLLITNY